LLRALRRKNVFKKRRVSKAAQKTRGFKFFLADGTWLLIRTSGTEPLVRVYTEATSAELREAMLAAGERLVRGT